MCYFPLPKHAICDVHQYITAQYRQFGPFGTSAVACEQPTSKIPNHCASLPPTPKIPNHLSSHAQNLNDLSLSSSAEQIRHRLLGGFPPPVLLATSLPPGRRSSAGWPPRRRPAAHPSSPPGSPSLTHAVALQSPNSSPPPPGSHAATPSYRQQRGVSDASRWLPAPAPSGCLLPSGLRSVDWGKWGMDLGNDWGFADLGNLGEHEEVGLPYCREQNLGLGLCWVQAARPTRVVLSLSLSVALLLM